MNFLKNTVKKASNGIELEVLKHERGTLNSDIKNLREKIAILDKKTKLKENLMQTMTYLRQTLADLSPECSLENVFCQEQDIPQTPENEQMSYKECLRISHSSLNDSYEKVKTVVESLDKEMMNGISKYELDIEKKTLRITEIENRLRVLREKGVL